LYTRGELERKFKGRKFAEERRTQNRKERVIATPFSSPQTLDPEVFVYVMIEAFRHEFQGEAFRKFLMQAVTQIAETDRIEETNSIEIRKLSLFQKRIHESIRKHNLIPKKVFVEGIEREVSPSLERLVGKLLYAQTRILAEIHWFRGLSSESQDELIHREPQYLKPLNSRVAKESILELQNYVQDDLTVYFNLQHAIEPLLTIG
jgi:hypothetical protein